MIYILIPDTPERQNRTAELVKSIRDNTHGVKYCIVVYPNNDGGWVPAVYNALEGINGMVWLLGSDCIVENNALKILYDTYQTLYPNNDGTCEPFNELHGENLCQHPLAHSDTIRKYLDKRFVHWYSDNWYTDQAKRDGKLAYVPEAKIQHNHFINGKAQIDETYKTIFGNKEVIEKDRLLYEELKNTYE